MTTTAFAPLTDQVARTSGLADLRVAVIDHPLGGIDERAVTARADSIVEALVAQFTGRHT